MKGYLILKRGLDLLGAGFGLLLFLPVGLLIALAIKVCDRGPVFYGQVRVGRGGKPFRIWKFRSMVPNADRFGVPVTGGADPRITRVGRWLRSTKMDELPQLWNVWVGEMSLVGPRPEVPKYVALYSEDEREILGQRPGITDVASLYFRDEEALLEGAASVEDFYVKHCVSRKIALNREYMARASLVGDLGVVARTIGLMLRRVAASWRGSARGRRGSGTGNPGGNVSVRELERPRVAIVGFGEGGRRLADRLLDRGPGVVHAFFDDDAHAWHGAYRGIPVVGMPECLLNSVWRARVDVVGIGLEKERKGRREELESSLRGVGYRVVSEGFNGVGDP